MVLVPLIQMNLELLTIQPERYALNTQVNFPESLTTVQGAEPSGLMDPAPSLGPGGCLPPGDNNG